MHSSSVASRGTRPRQAFTLIELMVSMAIAGILASVLITAMMSATQTARRARTQQLVSKLHAQILGRWEQYQMRRLPIDVPNVLAYQHRVTENDPSPYALRLAAYKLLALRELMRMEMPDRYEDISYQPMYLVNSNAGTAIPYTPDLQRLYTSRILAVRGGSSLNNALGQVGEAYLDPRKPGYKAPNDSAECLYLAVSAGTDDRAFLAASFTQADIGDTDNDGMLEFIDAWGEPIYWFRWPAGFESDLQPVFRIARNSPVARKYGSNQPTDPDNPSYLVTHYPTINDRLKSSSGARVAYETVMNYHDPFDPLEVDKWEPMPGNSKGVPSTLLPILSGSWDPKNPVYSIPERGYRLTPLIVSAGPNKTLGLVILPPVVDKNMPTDPYAAQKSPTGDLEQAASPTGDGSDADNVHSHRLGGSLR